MLILGRGRIGGALAAHPSGEGLALGRADDWSLLETADAPIVVATRNDDLDAVIDRVPAVRRAALVFVQNGMLRPWLATRGLAGATRGLLFFAVSRRGDTPVPGGPSPFTGPRAEEVVAWLEGMNLPARVVSPEDFAEVELEKLVWNCAFGLLCEALDAPVGEIVDAHGETFESLARELIALGSGPLGLSPDHDAMIERLAAYSRSIADYRGAVKEWAWRNGWFVGLATGAGTYAGSAHRRLLEAAGRDPQDGQRPD